MTETPEEKIVRAEELNQHGACAAAEALAREALALLPPLAEVSAGRNRCHALLVLADSLWQRGLAKEALLPAEEALVLAQNLGGEEGVTLLARAHNSIGSIYWSHSDYPRALESFGQALSLHESLGNRRGVAIITANIGVMYNYLADYPRALEFYSRALAVCEELGEEQFAVNIMGNIGIIYAKLSEYPRALEHYSKALAFHEKRGDNDGAALVAGNIGLLYAELSDYPRALEYYGNALAAHEKNGNKRGAALVTGSIGLARLNLADYPRALEYFSRSLAAFEEIGDKSGAAHATGNIGKLYRDKQDFPRALEYYFRALAASEDIGDKSGAAAVTGNIGILYANENSGVYDPAKAMLYLRKADEMNREIGTKSQNIGVLKTLAELSERQQDGQALAYYKQYHEFFIEVQSEEAKKTAEQFGYERRRAELEKQLATERARRDEREKIIGELTELNEALNEANREKNEVIGIVAHDLKNPLAGILLIADTTLRFSAKFSRADVDKQVEKIAAAAARMNDLILNLLDVQRLDSGKLHVDTTSVPALALVNSVVEAHSAQALAKNIGIVPPAVEQEIQVTANRNTLMEVLDNLLSNAIKFSPHGSRITVSIKEHEGGRVRIGVRDQGPGLTDDDKSKLFGKFMRLSAQPTGGENSTGLGLSIVKKLVEAINGMIWCESEAGKGAEFIVELTAADQDFSSESRGN